jgi:hypothetical protein
MSFGLMVHNQLLRNKIAPGRHGTFTSHHWSRRTFYDFHYYFLNDTCNFRRKEITVTFNIGSTLLGRYTEFWMYPAKHR